jgi:hypothetical protein
LLKGKASCIKVYDAVGGDRVMAAGAPPGPISVLEVLDRILDKGLVIDAFARVSLVGIEILTVEARVVVASIETYLKYAERVHEIGLVATPVMAPTAR